MANLLMAVPKISKNSQSSLSKASQRINNMLQSDFNRILFVLYFAFGSITTIVLIVKTIKNYRTDGQKKSSVITKFAVAFAVWAILSIYLLLATAITSIGDRVGPEPTIALNAQTIILIGHYIIWILVGSGLIYWLSKPPKTENIA